MWDIGVVEKCVGDFTLAVTFRYVVVFSIWASAGVFGWDFLVHFAYSFYVFVLYT